MVLEYDGSPKNNFWNGGIRGNQYGSREENGNNDDIDIQINTKNDKQNYIEKVLITK